MERHEIERLKDLYTRLVNDSMAWRSIFNLISQYVFMREYNDGLPGGAFIAHKISDNTASECLEKASSFVTGSVWKQGGNSFQYVPHADIPKTQAVVDYYAKISSIAAKGLDHPRSNVFMAFQLAIKEWFAYGTTGVMLEATGNVESPGFASLRNVKTMVLDDTARGYVDTVLDKCSLSVRDLVDTYGYDNVSRRIQLDHDSGKIDEKYEILRILAPRKVHSTLLGAKGKPIASLHIEWESDNILGESGYDEMPLFVARFSKTLGDMYGRSPAMAALPDIMNLNILTSTFNLISELKARPPLGTYQDIELNTNPGGVTHLDAPIPGMGNLPPVFPIYEPGDPRAIQERIAEAKTGVANAFLLDRLLDFNNDTRMTAYETSVRQGIQGVSTGSLYRSLEIELFNPFLTRWFNLSFDLNLFGVVDGSPEHLAEMERGEPSFLIPPEVVERMELGLDIYSIKYMTPASRALDAEQSQGILTLLDIVEKTTPQAPRLVDKLNFDHMLTTLAELLGVSGDNLNGDDVVLQIREHVAEQEKMLSEIELTGKAADAGFKNAQSAAVSRNSEGADLNVTN